MGATHVIGRWDIGSSGEEIEWRLVVGYGGEYGVREELFPALVAPEHLQTEQGLIATLAPELAAAFQAALELTTGRFDGS